MNHKLEAVFSAILLQKQIDKKIDLRAKANQFLSLNKLSEERIETDEEFHELYLSLSRSEFAFDGDGYTFDIKPRARKVYFRGKNPHRKMSKVLRGQSIYLVQGEFRRRSGRNLVIEFNYDGDGRSRLPNGEIVDNNLTDISLRFASEFDSSEFARGMDTQWKLSPEHHPDHANKGVAKFLGEIYGQMEPSLQDEIQEEISQV